LRVQSWDPLGKASGLRAEAPHELVFKVDLRLRPRLLVEMIAKSVADAQAFLCSRYDFEVADGRLRPGEYVDYLRILDADEERASNRKICSALWPHVSNAYPERTASKRLDKSRKVARDLRDGGYRVLPMLEAESVSRKGRRRD
jgi:hypothetical protein